MVEPVVTETFLISPPPVVAFGTVWTISLPVSVCTVTLLLMLDWLVLLTFKITFSTWLISLLLCEPRDKASEKYNSEGITKSPVQPPKTLKVTIVQVELTALVLTIFKMFTTALTLPVWIELAFRSPVAAMLFPPLLPFKVTLLSILAVFWLLNLKVVMLWQVTLPLPQMGLTKSWVRWPAVNSGWLKKRSAASLLKVLFISTIWELTRLLLAIVKTLA